MQVYRIYKAHKCELNLKDKVEFEASITGQYMYVRQLTGSPAPTLWLLTIPHSLQ